MTWSTSRSGILTSAVDRNSTLLIHVSTGGSSSGAPAVSTILLTGPSYGSRLNTRAFYLNTLTLETALRLQDDKTTSRRTAREISRSGREVHRNFESVRAVYAILRIHGRCSRRSRRDQVRELRECLFDILPGLRGRVEVRCTVRLGGSTDVGFGHVHLVFQIRLVREVRDGDISRHLEDRGDPLVQVVQGLPPCDVADREHALRAVEIRLLQEFSEALLAHDVPNRHVYVRAPVGSVDLELLLRDLRPQGGDVTVVELVLDETSDETRFADRAFADEADLDLHSLAIH